MDTRKSLLALALCAAALATAPDPSAAAHARHDGGTSRMVNAAPPVSLSEGQTLRVNFLNAGASPFEIIPCVFDGDGAHIKTGEAVTLAPGQTRSLDLSRAEAGRREEPGVVVRAGVHAGESDLKHLIVSGEVFDDATGRAGLFVAGASSQLEPVVAGEVTRSLAPVGIADGQALRVSFVNAGASPLEIIPCIFDGDGAHLKTGAPLRLAPGQTLSFEMSRAEALARADSRLLVRGAAHVRNADAKGLLISGEVVEGSNGRAVLFVPGLRAGFDPQPDPPALR